MCKTLALCCIATVKGVSVRTLYAIHATVCLWRVLGVAIESDITIPVKFGDSEIKVEYVVACVLGLYIFLTATEGIVTMIYKRGGEWKW